MSHAKFARAEAHKAQAFARKYRCATCWGVLVERIVPGGSYVECAKADADCDKTGFVTAHYVERRHSEDYADAHEARENLPFLKPERTGTAEEIIDALTGE